MRMQRTTHPDNDRDIQYWFLCPGCDEAHMYRIGEGEGPRWVFDGDAERPTFTPSMLVNGGGRGRRCHLFVRDGMIEFCGDCDHGLAGATVELPELPDWMRR